MQVAVKIQRFTATVPLKNRGKKKNVHIINYFSKRNSEFSNLKLHIALRQALIPADKIDIIIIQKTIQKDVL